MQAYREGNAGGSDVENAVQRYKSHRRVLSNHLFLFVLLYLENLLLQKLSVVYHTPFS